MPLLQVLKILQLIKWIIETVQSGYKLVQKKREAKQECKPLEHEEPIEESSSKEEFHNNNPRF